MAIVFDCYQEVGNISTRKHLPGRSSDRVARKRRVQYSQQPTVSLFQAGGAPIDRAGHGHTGAAAAHEQAHRGFGECAFSCFKFAP